MKSLANITMVLLITICLLSIFSTFCSVHSSDANNYSMSKEEREELKEEARDMFYHAYRAYMENAYPADELMPLSCTGRYRGLGPSRGDIDDCLGNFSLTLVDTMDTLAVLGDLEEFEHAVNLVIKDVSFDNDIVVSVFETNIRMLGGLLSGHILAEYLQQRAGIMSWYRGELLTMAKDLGYRLLPAFNTSTGLPHARVNLKYGLKSPTLENSRETCTACAGTLILEMAALSRLSGEPVFEEKAHKAMDALWQMRHRSSDLMGTVFNVHSGDWVRKDSGVGAGIDSYYEYCLKAYVLLGDEKYLGRFNKHYTAVMKYISQGPMLLDVLMHRPHTNSRNFMDALLAFWPGLQVLKGDIRPAVETHEMLYQVMQRHNFIPEAFTTDFQVHWGQHPLRPEFLESTYFLYKATQDPYYLQVGKHVLKSLQTYARVPCGYAAMKDVRTTAHEDRMDSFVLAETFKYLFLLFADPSELVLDLDEFVFTTEAHLLPLSLARRTNVTSSKDAHPHKESEDLQFSRTCPNTLHLFPESVRRPLKNLVNGVCPRRGSRRKLHAGQFQIGNPEHMKNIRDMGITILNLPDGRIQLLHAYGDAKSHNDAEEGLQFMQEMLDISRTQTQTSDSTPISISFSIIPPGAIKTQKVSLTAGPAHFGRDIRGHSKIVGKIAITEPLKVCGEIVNREKIKGRIAIMERGECMFVDKARKVEKAGAIAAIVLDNASGSSARTSPLFAMSGDGTNDVKIPVAFLFQQDALQLLQALALDPSLLVTISDSTAEEKMRHHEKTAMMEKELEKSGLLQEAAENMDSALLQTILDRLKGSVKDFLLTSPQKSPSDTPSDENEKKLRKKNYVGVIGGAQDGDGLGTSSIRENIGSGVPIVEGTGRNNVNNEEVDIETRLRQLVELLSGGGGNTATETITEQQTTPTTKQTPKFSELIDNILNSPSLSSSSSILSSSTSKDTNINSDQIRDKVRVFKIRDIIEELDENNGELKRGIVELLERKQADGWKPSSRETVESLIKASIEQHSKEQEETLIKATVEHQKQLNKDNDEKTLKSRKAVDEL